MRRRWRSMALCAAAALSSHTLILANDTDGGSIQKPSAVPESHAPTNVFQRWFRHDQRRLTAGFGGTRLLNPVGFDLPTITYSTGLPEELFFSSEFTVQAALERQVAWGGRTKQLWTAHYDRVDFDGLQLNNLLLGAGVSVSPAQTLAFGGRLAAGVSGGVTRTKSYFDDALHLAMEVWVGAGLQLGPFVLDVSLRERASSGSTLDERSASPRTRLRSVSMGYLF